MNDRSWTRLRDVSYNILDCMSLDIQSWDESTFIPNKKYIKFTPYTLSSGTTLLAYPSV